LNQRQPSGEKIDLDLSPKAESVPMATSKTPRNTVLPKSRKFDVKTL